MTAQQNNNHNQMTNSTITANAANQQQSGMISQSTMSDQVGANAQTGMQAASGMQNQTAGVQTQTAITSQQGMQQQQGAQQSQGMQGVKAVIGVFNDRSAAEEAVKTLRSSGFSTEEINIVSKEGKKKSGGAEYYDDDVSDGALTGGTLGGLGGLILGAGALAIPGIGPIVAAGPIAAAISGAVAGGIAGGLIDWGIPAEVSRRYEQSVAQGGILAVIRTNGSKVNQAAQILRQNGANDVESHNAQ